MKGMRTESFKVGDKVRVPMSGWTGEVVEKSDNRNNGYKVRWDDKTRRSHQSSSETSWVRPMNMEHQ